MNGVETNKSADMMTVVPPSLTNRQKEIAGLRGFGITDDEIADRLNISQKTVRTHFDIMVRRLGTHSRTEFIIKAIDLNLMESPYNGIELEQDMIDTLTDTEKGIMIDLLDKYKGINSSEIDKRNPHTLRTHLTNIYPKLGVHEKVNALVLFMELQKRKAEEEINQAAL